MDRVAANAVFGDGGQNIAAGGGQGVQRDAAGGKLFRRQSSAAAIEEIVGIDIQVIDLIGRGGAEVGTRKGEYRYRRVRHGRRSYDKCLL